MASLEEDSSSSNPDKASCPICNKSVQIDKINSHLDVCLLPGGEHLQLEKSETEKEKVSSLKSVSQGTPKSKKRSSPSVSGGKVAQSVLSFAKTSSLLQVSPSGSGVKESDDRPPPVKIRKTDDTPTSSQRRTTRRPALLTTEPPSGPSPPSVIDLQAPLAEVMRPKSVDGYVGQENVVGRNALLRNILDTGQVPSLIFWGPPGCGKTTLARIIARVAKEKCGCRFVQLSATTSGVSEVKEVVKIARNEKAFKRKTILFVDEIHRFNKLQQDTFLPPVEDGTIVLLGATTENPSFQLNSALLSRCRVVVLEKLSVEEVRVILTRAAEELGVGVAESGTEGRDSGVGEGKVLIEAAALTTLAELCDGDARSALNGFQLAVQAKLAHSSIARERPSLKQSQTSSEEEQRNSDSNQPSTMEQSSDIKQNLPSSTNEKGSSVSPLSASITMVTVDDVKESLQRTHLLYDRAGEEHYNIISALHKSMRGSDANAALYWLARMLCAGEDPLYVARRVVSFASEDIGLADPNALTQAIAAFQGCQFLGMPACEVLLAQAVVYMARAPKSAEVYLAYGQAKQCVMEHKGPLPSVPLHLRNASTQLMKSLGYGRGYKYNPGCVGGTVEQEYMPEGMQKVDFFSAASLSSFSHP